jgi:hypothetical protein
MNYNKIREPFDSEYLITFEVLCDPINDRRVDKNSWTNPYLFIDYIKIYYSSDSKTDESIQNKTGNLRNITEIAENGSEINDSAVNKYVIADILVLPFVIFYYLLNLLVSN